MSKGKPEITLVERIILASPERILLAVVGQGIAVLVGLGLHCALKDIVVAMIAAVVVGRIMNMAGL